MARKKSATAPEEPKVKREKKPARPASELLTIARGKVARFTRLKATWEAKVAALETKATQQLSDSEILAAINGKTPQQVAQELAEAAKTTALLKRAQKLLSGLEAAESTSTDVPSFLVAQ